MSSPPRCRDHGVNCKLPQSAAPYSVRSLLVSDRSGIVQVREMNDDFQSMKFALSALEMKDSLLCHSTPPEEDVGQQSSHRSPQANKLASGEVDHWSNVLTGLEMTDSATYNRCPNDVEVEPFHLHLHGADFTRLEMDGGLWSQLPEPLQDRVLAWMPVRHFFRVRCVCKRWRNLLNDSSFLLMCAMGPSHAPWCILPQKSGYAVYDPTSNSWHKWPNFEFPTSFVDSSGRAHRLPTNFVNLSAPYHSQEGLGKLEKYEITGATSGLLLLEHSYDSCRTLFVTNPINKSSSLLNLPVEVKMTDLSRILGIVTDMETRTYKLFAVYGSVADDASYRYLPRFQLNIEGWLSHYSQAPLQFNVYDSGSHSWERTGEWNKQFRRYFRSVAFYRGSIYCLASDRQFDVLDDFQTYHVYCIAPEGWLEVLAPLPSSMNFAHLFENRGRLMLAGGFGDMQRLETLHIWYLDPDASKWIQKHSMPEELIRALSVPDTFYYGCASSGDYVCVCNSIRRLVMCDTARGHWWYVPSCPFEDDTPRSFLDEVPSGSLFMFQPRLDIFA